MHAPTSYERYLLHERSRYGWESNEENDFPTWLMLEEETYNWMFSLIRKMDQVHGGVVSGQFLSRIDALPSIRFLRYRDISPSLKKAIKDITVEFASLRDDLKQPEMWKRPNLLSRTGAERWKKAAKTVDKSIYAVPDPIWRENWEKENTYPNLTRKEAEDLASEYILQRTGIDLDEIDPSDGKRKYSAFFSAKNGIFKLRYGVWGKLGDPSHNYGIVEVNMLTRDINMVNQEK